MDAQREADEFFEGYAQALLDRAASPHSIWADVVWSYDGQPRERTIYQLLKSESGWQVGVLTPLGPEDQPTR